MAISEEELHHLKPQQEGAMLEHGFGRFIHWVSVLGVVVIFGLAVFVVCDTIFSKSTREVYKNGAEQLAKDLKPVGPGREGR